MNSLGPLGDFATLEIEHVLPLTLDKELWQIAPSLRTPKSKWIGGPSNDKTTGDLISHYYLIILGIVIRNIVPLLISELTSIEP